MRSVNRILTIFIVFTFILSTGIIALGSTKKVTTAVKRSYTVKKSTSKSKVIPKKKPAPKKKVVKKPAVKKSSAKKRVVKKPVVKKPVAVSKTTSLPKSGAPSVQTKGTSATAASASGTSTSQSSSSTATSSTSTSGSTTTGAITVQPQSSDTTQSGVILDTTTGGAVTPKTVLGFATYYYTGDKESYNSIAAYGSQINQIATDTYDTDGQGNLTGVVPVSQINLANSMGIKTMAMITNDFSGSVAKTLLESPSNRQNLIQNLLGAIKMNGYKGVSIDIEGIYSSDRDYFTQFVQEMYSALHPQGYLVNVCVAAKTRDSLTDGWSGAFDYKSLSNISDSIVLMTYDEHYAGGTPGPVASIGWVENVIKYSLTVIPKEKILFGVAAYGYDWGQGAAKAYGVEGMYKIASENNAVVMFDDISKTPYFNYTDVNGTSHSAWFENGTSLGYKLDLVNKYDLNGIAIWRLGLENSDYWNAIKTKLQQ